MAEELVPIFVAFRLLIVGGGTQPWKARVWPDNAPARAKFPYVTLKDFVADQPAKQGDGVVTARARLGQADLWELAAEEDPSADGALALLKGIIDGARLRGIVQGTDTASAENLVYRCRLRDTIRDPTGFAPDQTPKIAHHSLDVALAYAV